MATLANTQWSAADTAWGSAAAVFSRARPVQIISDLFYIADTGEDFAGQDIEVILSREGLTVFAVDQEGNPKSDPRIVKVVQGLWPEIQAPEGTVIQVYVGWQEGPNRAVTWLGPRNFTIGTDTFLDFPVEGRFISVRFESLGQPNWILTGYDLEVNPAGGSGGI